MGATACDLASELVRKKKEKNEEKKIPKEKKNKLKKQNKNNGEKPTLATALMTMCLSCLVVPICLI